MVYVDLVKRFCNWIVNVIIWKLFCWIFFLHHGKFWSNVRPYFKNCSFSDSSSCALPFFIPHVCGHVEVNGFLHLKKPNCLRYTNFSSSFFFLKFSFFKYSYWWYTRDAFKKSPKKVENFIRMNKIPKKVTKFTKMWIHFAQDSYPKKSEKSPKKR